MRAVVEINSIPITKPGIISKLIFLKNVGKVATKDKDGFEIKIEKFVESAECKEKWIKAEFVDDNESYPRLGEKAYLNLKNKHR